MDCNTTKEGYTGGRKSERTERNKRELEIKEARKQQKGKGGYEVRERMRADLQTVRRFFHTRRHQQKGDWD